MRIAKIEIPNWVGPTLVVLGLIVVVFVIVDWFVGDKLKVEVVMEFGMDVCERKDIREAYINGELIAPLLKEKK